MQRKKNDNPPQLGDNARDREAAVLRALAGIVPYGGAILAEILTNIIPDQRMERIEKYLRYLWQELEQLKLDSLEQRLKTPESIDLLEDGAYQAVRALTDERLHYISKCVASGIASDDLDHIREKRVLSILSQLDDEEILILDAYGSEIGEATPKFQQLVPPRPTINADMQTRERYALFEAATAKLERLSLVTQRVDMNRDAKKSLGLELPKFDHFTGRPTGRSDITPLGRLLLRKIGLLPDKS